MYILVGILSILTVLWLYKVLKKTAVLNLPGPKGVPILGNAPELNSGAIVHMKLTEWAREFGPIYKLNIVGLNVVVVSGCKEMYDFLVVKGRDFAVRKEMYRSKIMFEDRQDLMTLSYGPENIFRRKILQGHLKQYGEGIERIESISQEIITDMIQNLIKNEGKAMDVETILNDAMIDVTYALALGEKLTDNEERKEIKKVVQYMVSIMSFSGNGSWLDIFPWLRFFGNQTYKDLLDMANIRRKLTAKWRERADEIRDDRNIVFKMTEMIKAANEHNLTELNVDLMTWQLFLGGTSTTVATLSVLMNVLVHKPEIQRKLQQEIYEKLGQSAVICFKDRHKLPYCYATILELSRFTTVVPIAFPHMAMTASQIQNHHIPSGTCVWPNLWGMHHNPDVFKEPFFFKPDRFLDTDGKLVPADHPHRVSLMPFSAGPRVCTGEKFAMTRMFLILGMLMQRVDILPETTAVRQPTCDPREMRLGVVLYPMPFKVRFVERN